MNAAIFVLSLLLFVLPCYVFAIGLYDRRGWTHLPSERIAVGGIVAFAVLGVIALPAYGFDFSLPLIAAVYLASVLAVVIVLHRRAMLAIRRVPGAVMQAVRRDWLLLLCGAAAFLITVPFCRYYPEGTDVLYFVGVVRKYIAIGHVTQANVIYGNGGPDTLYGSNLWVLFLAVVGWLAHLEPLTLFAWMAGLLAAIWIFVQRLLYRAAGADEMGAQILALLVTTVSIFQGGYRLHGVDVDLLPNQAHRAAYPKIILYNGLVPLMAVLLIRFLGSNRRVYLVLLALAGMVALEIHPLEAIWLGWSCGVLALVLLATAPRASQWRWLFGAMVLFTVISTPYLVMRLGVVQRLHANQLVTSIQKPTGNEVADFVVPVGSALRVQPEFLFGALFLPVVAIALAVIVGIRRRYATALAVLVLAPAVLGLSTWIAPWVGKTFSLDLLVRLAGYGSNLTPCLFGIAGSLAFARLLPRRRAIRAAAAIAIVTVCLADGWAERGLFRQDYLADREVRDLERELRSPVTLAMAKLPAGSVIFGGDRMRVLRQVLVLTNHFLYLDDRRQVWCLSPQEARARTNIWNAVMAPGSSAVDRYRMLSRAGIHYLLVPQANFAAVQGSPLFEWTARTRPGEDIDVFLFGRLRDRQGLTRYLDDESRVLSGLRLPFINLYERLGRLLELTSMLGEERRIEPLARRFAAAPAAEAFALFDRIRRDSSDPNLRQISDRWLDRCPWTAATGSVVRVRRYSIEGAPNARADYFPLKLDDGNPMTGLVMTDTNPPFTITADLGTWHVVTAVKVTTTFMNEHYYFPVTTVYSSLDGKVWERMGEIGPLDKPTTGVFALLNLGGVRRMARYVRLAVPVTGNVSVTEFGVEGISVGAKG